MQEEYEIRRRLGAKGYPNDRIFVVRMPASGAVIWKAIITDTQGQDWLTKQGTIAEIYAWITGVPPAK